MAGEIHVVTGASGHLGNVLVRTLSSKGARIRGLFRSPPSLDFPQDIEIAYGDICDASSLENAFHHAERVYHVAGLVAIGGGARNSLHRVNVGGTQNVIRACSRCNVKRLIYVSSIEAFDLSAKYIDANSPVRPDHTILEYGKSKALATLEVLTAAQSRAIDATVVFPTGFVGPHDYKLSPISKLVADFYRRKVPAAASGGFDFVDVRDVAAGLIAAGEVGANGSKYIMAGTYVTVRELFSILQGLTGIAGPRFCIPRAANCTVGLLAQAYSFLKNSQPRYTRKSLKLLSLGVSIDGAKAEKELGFRPRPIVESLRDTVGWLLSRGFLSGLATG